MTILAQYVPEKFDFPQPGTGGGAYFFTMESIGAQAIEVWAETEDPSNLGTYIRDKIPPSYYNLAFAGEGWTRVGGVVLLAKGIVKDGVERISVERNTPIYQNVDYKNFEAFPMKSIEFAADRATMIIQELAFRKCNVAPITGPIDQLIPFDPYGVLYSATLDFVLDKIMAYLVEMDANGVDCSNNLDETGANYDSTDNSDDNGQLNFGQLRVSPFLPPGFLP